MTLRRDLAFKLGCRLEAGEKSDKQGFGPWTLVNCSKQLLKDRIQGEPKIQIKDGKPNWVYQVGESQIFVVIDEAPQSDTLRSATVIIL